MTAPIRPFALTVVLVCASGIGARAETTPRTATGAAAPRPAAVSPLGVRASLSRTAVWVGDRVTYTVEIACPPGTDLLADDLGRDRLRLDGFELVDATVERTTRPDGGTVHRAQYELTTFLTDAPLLRIHPLPVRYYVRQPGERSENLRPAEEVEVPAQDVPLRSTLPPSGPRGIRDEPRFERLPRAVSLLRPVAVGAILLAIAPVVLGTLAAIARLRQAAPRRRVRRLTPRERQQALDELRVMAGSTDVSTRRDAFDRLDLLVREHLEQADVPAFALPPDEVERFVGEHRSGLEASAIGDLLRECERIRYTPPEDTPAGDVLRAAVDRAASFLEGTRG